MLYIRFLEEKHENGVIKIVPSDRCAVFEEATLDKLISETRMQLRELRRLKEQAQTHSHLISEDSLRMLHVPYEVKRFVEKKG
jgi:hypothetical protein